MPVGSYFFATLVNAEKAPVIGRPHRDRSKVKAGRKAARRNKRH